jgi:putative ABC transport system ATP-binding protein
LSDPLITGHRIGQIFGTGANAFTALCDLDIEVRAGEVLLLMGPSGSGKTTLIHILGGLLRPTRGSVHICGQDIAGLSDDALGALRLRLFGFVFQAYNLFPVLTATENVLVAFDLMHVALQAGRQRARDLLSEVGLANRLDAYPGQLSSGQMQRVAIARALANDPQILMADEPTAALDADNGHKAMQLFQMLAHDQGRAVVIVTHDPRILPFADRIVYLEDGRIRPEPAPQAANALVKTGVAS